MSLRNRTYRGLANGLVKIGPSKNQHLEEFYWRRGVLGQHLRTTNINFQIQDLFPSGTSKHVPNGTKPMKIDQHDLKNNYSIIRNNTLLFSFNQL